MLSNLDPASQRFLSDLNRIQSRNSTAQEQVSSGLKVQLASDSPDEIGALLQLLSRQSANSQLQTNLGRIQSEATSADNALTSAVEITDKITQLAGQGLSAPTAQDRAIYAQQVKDFQQQLISLTNVSVEGRYVFSGDDSPAAPYQYDATAANPAVRISGTTATRQTSDASGSLFAYSRSAQDIFDHRDAADNPAADNLFTAVNNALIALNANDTAGISAAIDSLHTASTYLGSQQSFYGSVENRITTSLSASQSLDTALKTQISGIRDADSVQASLELTRGSTQLQAALAAEAKSQNKSLFDYLA